MGHPVHVSMVMPIYGLLDLAAGKGGYRSVKGLARGHIENTTADGKIDRLIAGAVEGEEGSRSECAEDHGRWRLGEGDGGGRTEMPVDQEDEEGE